MRGARALSMLIAPAPDVARPRPGGRVARRDTRAGAVTQALSVMVALAAAGPAAAEVPLQECHDDAVGGYDIIWHHGGFVLYPGRYSHADYRLTLEDCPGDRALQIVLAYAGSDLVEKWDQDEALIAAVEKALQSKRRYTMGQIAAIARENGARTRIAPLGYESCACATYGTVNP